MIHAAIYVIVPINIDVANIPTVVSVNGTNFTFISSVCLIQTLSFYRSISITYLVESNFLPFSIMLVASVMTVHTLIVSRNRIEALENRENKSRRARDIKFAINSIVLDVLFVLFQTPISFTYFIDIPDLLTYYTFYLTSALLYTLNYCLPIFTYICSNSLFRRELLRIVGIKSKKSQSTWTQSRYNTN